MRIEFARTRMGEVKRSSGQGGEGEGEGGEGEGEEAHGDDGTYHEGTVDAEQHVGGEING